MKKFLAGCLLINMLSASAGSFVKACPTECTCSSYSRFSSDKKKKEENNNSGVSSFFVKVVKDVAKSAKKIVEVGTAVYLATDALVYGGDSLVGQACSKTKGYAENVCGTAGGYVKKTVEGVKSKIAECTKGKEGWEKTFGYFSNSEDGTSFFSMANEVASNSYDFSKKVFNSVTESVSSGLLNFLGKPSKDDVSPCVSGITVKEEESFREKEESPDVLPAVLPSSEGKLAKVEELFGEKKESLDVLPTVLPSSESEPAPVAFIGAEDSKIGA